MDLEGQHIIALLQDGQVFGKEKEAGGNSPGRELGFRIAIDGILVVGRTVTRPHVGAGDLDAVEVRHKAVVIIDEKKC